MTKLLLFSILFFLIFLCSDTWTEFEEACGSIFIIIVAILCVVLLYSHTLQHVICNLEEKPLRSLWIELSDNTETHKGSKSLLNWFRNGVEWGG